MSWNHWGRGRTLGSGSADPTGDSSPGPRASPAQRAAAARAASEATRPIKHESGPPVPALTGNWKVDLAKSLDAIKRKGDFATHQRYAEHANPGLHVKDSLISMPLCEDDADIIRSAARQAPFGKGDKTLVDKSVRDTWELDTTSFRLDNPAWAPFLSKMLADASKALGMPEVKLEPYKLLLYDKGSFFRPHKDSEKTPGMIATLSICLPSDHKGGEVHLAHGGKRQVIDTSTNMYTLNALAWYSDVTHEVKPVADGHRLVLIYNIIRAQTAGPSLAVSASFFAGQNQHLEGILSRWATQNPSTPRLVYFLEHKYSQTSLRASNLKGRDQAVFGVLESICGSQDLFIFLGNVTRTESDQYCDGKLADDDSGGEIEEDNGYNGYGRYGGYGYGEKEIERGIVLSLMCTGDGTAVGHSVKIEKSTILGRPYGGREPDSEDEGEFTGNESMPNEYRYHNSAVILVPKDRLSQLVGKDADCDALLSIVEAELKSSGDSAEMTPSSRRLAYSFMASALKSSDPKLATRIALLAWKMSDRDLFDAAIRACFISPSNSGKYAEAAEVRKVTEALAKQTAEWTGKSVDWNAWLGSYTRSHGSLTQLSDSLAHFAKLLPPDQALRYSFAAWRPSAELLAYEAKSRLGLADHDSVINLATLKWKNRDWIKTTFTQRLEEAGDKFLVSKVICSLLQKGRDGVLDQAESIVDHILSRVIATLAIGAMDLNTIHDKPSYNEANRFNDLIKECLKSNLAHRATELMRVSLAPLKAQKHQSRGVLGPGATPVPVLAQDFIEILLEHLKDANLEPDGASRDFIVYILRNFISHNHPKYPKAPKGWTHSGRGCSSCKHCTELDAFLVSSAEQEHVFLNKGPQITKHMQERLGFNYHHREQNTARDDKGFFTFEKTPGQKSGSFDLTVTKLGGEYSAKLKEYAREYQMLDAKVKDLRGEYTERLLGKEIYDQLVMLEKLPKPAKDEPGRSGGTKRGADDDAGDPQGGDKRIKTE